MAAPERRVKRRVDASFEISYIHEGDYLISFSRDISVDGMFIYTRTPLPIGASTRLSFSVTGLDNPIEVNAKVIWANTHGGKKDNGIGVQFVDPPEQIRETILQYVNRVAVLCGI
ncbi:MAG: PilZ domain-containing protein [Thermodesulfobacteriota bacterium]